MSTAELSRILSAADGYVDAINVDEDAHLVLPAGTANGKGNHGCDPNLWWGPPYTLVARREIAAGEELTNDYATSTGVREFEMSCRCEAAGCRGVVTGEDWRRLDLRERYGDHWTPALLRLIRADQR
ncbi:SET domain-containing protein-lysine N-methyltransferase [Actinoplanes sp. LDG1-01]|uniref:SET domain-containing protein-lysine N-methyltransferase n=1 Tax=Paractinoplanes lichenicola TaxID=2802976 RepID=A0ABS1VTC7_9ACTN|nr:SET domain-containing protein-lysine N-methyltransferase [Actinoplanes lichenicola]MBL7257719.1 SET domain-containing protein-lysine N-methyltransferase [Actinoplanes lichenicola]